MVARIKAILAQPQSEWRVIDGEPASVGGLMTGWVVPLAAIGPVASVIAALAFGYGVPGMPYAVPVGSVIAMSVASYVMTLVGVFLFALVINALAPSFGGQGNAVQAMKVAAYGSTAGFLAGIFQIFPPLAFLTLIGLYNLYLIYVGLPILMRVPPEKAVGYIVVAILAMIVIYLVVAAIAGSLAVAFLPRPAIPVFTP
jgi:hypothetical protein